MRTVLNIFLLAVCGVLSAWSGTVSNAQIRIEESDREVRVFRMDATKPFASWVKSEGCDLRIRLQGNWPFAFVDLRPKSVGAPHKLGTVHLPSVRIDGLSRLPVTLRSDGLKPVDWALPSCGTLAVAEPFTRKGVVFGWIANLNACGAFATTNAAGGVCVTPLADFGPMPSDTVVAEPDTFVVGAFDDCRLGLEAYADAAAERFGIRLPPNRTGYCTWCSDRYGYSDRTVFARGCGAGSERSTREYAAAAERILKPYGFEFVQFDDQWQNGKELNGPARDFTRTDPQGPYPNGFRPIVDHLNGKGFAAGLWFIPFGGVAEDPFWAKQGDVYVKSFAEIATRTEGSPFDRPIALPRKAGDPIRMIWGGECLDLTNPKARAILADEVRRFTVDWGFRYLKCDGIFTGLAGDLYGGFGWRDVNFSNAVFQDRNASNVQAFRRGFETIRRAAAPGTFILGCNLGTIRAMVPSFGLVDGMRIGNDNGPIDRFAGRYIEGPMAGSWRYFLNGRVFWCDPDSTYVRASIPLGRARSMASWTALTDSLYELGDWLPDLPEERVEILRRTMAHHGSTNVRPIDLFENDLPNGWILDGGAHKVIGVFNWNTNAALKVEYPFSFAGLDSSKTYVGWDFWRNEPVRPFSGTFRLEVPADDCRVIALAEVRKGEKVLVSTSRHVTSPIFDKLNPCAAKIPGETTVCRFYSEDKGFEVSE